MLLRFPDLENVLCSFARLENMKLVVSEIHRIVIDDLAAALPDTCFLEVVGETVEEPDGHVASEHHYSEAYSASSQRTGSDESGSSEGSEGSSSGSESDNERN